MDIQLLMQRSHIFKKRTQTIVKRKFKFKMGTSGLFSLKPQRFELVYIRGFKKMMRRKYLKGHTRFRFRKIWFFLTPNIILSSKSTNSRMGAGVGKLVRIAVKLYSYKSFVEFKLYSPFWVRRVHIAARHRYRLKFIGVVKQ